MELALVHQAADDGDVAALLSELDRGAAIELGTPGYHETPLHRAAERGHLSAVKALIERGCDVNATRRGGFTALHLAANEAVADALLEAGIDPSIRSSNGFTAMQQCSGGAAVRFHIAASPGPAAIVAAEAAAVQRRTGQYSATGGGVPSSPRQPFSPRLSGPEELVSDRWRDREQYGAAESTGALSTARTSSEEAAIETETINCCTTG